jgi:uncharacterized protein
VSYNFISNLISPPFLFFILGCIAGFLKSEIDVPKSISRYFALYLMIAIGFKGGVSFAESLNISLQMILVVLAGVLLSFTLPYLAFFFLKKTTKLDSPTMAAVSAHYGSISMVTFLTASAFLDVKNIPYEGYVVGIVALMEAPAILSGLHLAHLFSPKTKKSAQKTSMQLAKEIFTNGAILILLGCFIIGWITGEPGLQKLKGFLVDPFQGFLSFFLLDMGFVVSKQFQAVTHFRLPIILFGIYMPLAGAVFGILISWGIGLDLGTALLFTILAASASYIAVPAAMRLSLPEADPSIYIPLTLGITFPLNICLGIPFYYMILQKVLS